MVETREVAVPWHGEAASEIAAAAWNAATEYVRENEQSPVQRVESKPGSTAVAGLSVPQAPVLEAAEEALREHHPDEVPEEFAAVSVSVAVEGDAKVVIEVLD